MRICTPGTLLVNAPARLLFPGTCTTFKSLMATRSCSHRYLVWMCLAFPSPIRLTVPSAELSRIPLLADQVLDLATAIVCPTPCFLPSQRLIHVFACGKGYGRLGMAGMFERMRSEQCQHPGRRSSGDSATSMVAVHLHSDTAWHPLLCKDLNEVWIFLEESTQPLKIAALCLSRVDHSPCEVFHRM